MTVLLATVAVLALATYVAVRRRRIRAHYAGRRDQLAGTVDAARTRTDPAYLDGALSETLRARRAAR